MHICLLLFALLPISPLFCMQGPARLRMSEEDEREFNKLVPPPILHMTDEELTQSNRSWFQTKEEFADYNREFNENPLIQKICNNPEINNEFVVTLIKKTEARSKKQIAGCCLQVIKPGKFVVLTAAFACGAYREAQQGNVCNSYVPFCCLFACGTLGKCITSYKTIQVYSKKIQKSCSARNMFFDLLMRISETNGKKKTQ